MSNLPIEKETFLNLYNQLSYNYKVVILNTFKCIVSYDNKPIKGYKPYDVAGLITYYRNKLGYTEQELCDKVNEIMWANNPSSDLFLCPSNFHKMIQRNSQTSKKKTDWLALIAQALGFDPKEYHNYLTDDGIKHSAELITNAPTNAASIESLYDLLTDKEKTAIFQLTMSLYQLTNISEYNSEELDYQNINAE